MRLCTKGSVFILENSVHKPGAVINDASVSVISFGCPWVCKAATFQFSSSCCEKYKQLTGSCSRNLSVTSPYYSLKAVSNILIKATWHLPLRFFFFFYYYFFFKSLLNVKNRERNELKEALPWWKCLFSSLRVFCGGSERQPVKANQPTTTG